MKWYRLAAAQGNAMAQTTLALIYDTGRGVPQNYWQAVKWYGSPPNRAFLSHRTISG